MLKTWNQGQGPKQGLCY